MLNLTKEQIKKEVSTLTALCSDGRHQVEQALLRLSGHSEEKKAPKFEVNTLWGTSWGYTVYLILPYSECIEINGDCEFRVVSLDKLKNWVAHGTDVRCLGKVTRSNILDSLKEG